MSRNNQSNIQCPHCGTWNSNSDVCQNCGRLLHIPEQAPKDYKPIISLVIVLAFVSASIAVFFLLKERISSKKQDTNVVVIDSDSRVSQDVNVGDSIIFGRYEQDNDVSNGKEDIEWIVLKKEENKAMVISKYVLDYAEYNDEYTSVTWNDCSLRTWLSEYFYNQCIPVDFWYKTIRTTVSNNDNPRYGTPGGDNTQDYMFLLSIEEVENYFPTIEDRKCEQTAYAKAIRATIKKGDNSESADWWLRSPGGTDVWAAFVFASGNIEYDGTATSYRKGIRPAMWIDLEAEL